MVIPAALTRHFSQGSLLDLCPELRHDQGAKVREFVSQSTWHDTAAGPVTFQPAVDTELGRSVISCAPRVMPEMKVGRVFARIQSSKQPMRFHQDRNCWHTRLVGRFASSEAESWIEFKEVGRNTEVHRFHLSSGDWYTGNNALMCGHDGNLQHGVFVDLPPGEHQLSVICDLMFGEEDTSDIVERLTAQRLVEDRLLLQRKLQWGNDSMLLHVMNEEMSAAEELMARSQSGSHGPISKYIVRSCAVYSVAVA